MVPRLSALGVVSSDARPRRVLALLGLAWSLAAPGVAEARTSTPVGNAVVGGSCTSLQVPDENLVGGCAGHLIRTRLAKGRTAFFFQAKDGTTVTFSGVGSIAATASGSRLLPIDSVIVSKAGQTRRVSGIGSCRFGDMFHAVADIACEAKTPDGRFEGAFVTDGKPLAGQPF